MPGSGRLMKAQGETKMTQLKTRQNEQSVQAFLAALPDGQRRQDCETVLAMMRQATGTEPKMWGDVIVGFGSLHYKYATGREGDWFRLGFSPRKQNLTLYLPTGFEAHADLLARLGKHKTAVSCLYIKRLADVDLSVLNELLVRAVSQPANQG